MANGEATIVLPKQLVGKASKYAVVFKLGE